MKHLIRHQALADIVTGLQTLYPAIPVVVRNILRRISKLWFVQVDDSMKHHETTSNDQ